MTRLKVGADVTVNKGTDNEQKGYIEFACGKESFMVHLIDGGSVMLHKSALTLSERKTEPKEANATIMDSETGRTQTVKPGDVTKF